MELQYTRTIQEITGNNRVFSKQLLSWSAYKTNYGHLLQNFLFSGVLIPLHFHKIY